MDQEIIVTGRRLPQVDFWWDFWGLRGWASTGFSSYMVGESGGGGSTSTVESQVPSDPTTFDIVIAATEDRPKIELNDLTKAQAEKVLDFLDRVGRDPKLAAALDQMADRGVTLRITFADQLPAGADPSARATIQFPVAVEADFQTQGFQPSSVVNITIDRDQINNSNWESSLEGILAHEFTHFYRDSNGRFLDDLYDGGTPGNSVQDFDDSVYQNLYGTAVDGSYTNSLDIVYGSLSYGQTVQVSGTNGNNLIKFQNDMSNSTVNTGAGNDFIFTMDGDDWITADLNGVKAIYDKGAGTDVVDIFIGYFEVRLTQINSDLYITSTYSAYSPVEDPNAVILLDHFNGGQGVEYLRVSGGWLADLSAMWAAQSQGMAYSAEHATLPADGSSVPEDIASAYASGTVATVLASSVETIPEHLRHLVGGATTMTTYAIVAPGGQFDVIDKNAFVQGDASDYVVMDSFIGASPSELLLADIAYL